jgi:hypothetical protein
MCGRNFRFLDKGVRWSHVWHLGGLGTIAQRLAKRRRVPYLWYGYCAAFGLS